MKKYLFAFILLTFGVTLFVSSCKTENEDPNPAYTLTQTELNGATDTEEMDVTGRKYGDDVSIPHGGTDLTSDDTYRDIYSNVGSGKSAAASTKGTIFTKRTYVKNADGSKGDLLVTFAMAKREAGYFTEGGDWEYVMMPNEGSNDYGANPNGMLPDVSATEMRGKLGMCAGCHSEAGNDYIFSQGEAPAFKASQADLNAATNVEDMDITGTEYGEDVSIPHGGVDLTSDDTYRDAYSNIGSKEDISVGTVLTKRTYLKNGDDSKGDLLVTFAMIKREEGYWSAGGDWEYVKMPNDGTNDYTINPNGMLPEVDNIVRGQLAGCAECHSASPTYSFIRPASK